MPLDDVINLIRFAEENNVQKFIVSGGEAALHANFRDLVDYIKVNKPNLKMVVQSNGLIGEMDIETIKAFNIVHLSFETDDSAVRKTSVKKTVEIAKRLINSGIYTYFFATVHPGNIDKIDWMVKIANHNSIDIGFNLCIPGDKEDLQLTPNQKVEVVKKLHQLYLDKRTLRFTSPFAAILKDQKTERYVGIKGGCTAGVAACVILPNGDVVPCPFFRLKAGNIYENDLKQLWFESKIFNALRNRLAFDEPCGKCEYLSYCGGCRARAYYQKNKLNGSDADCIKI
jgi:radical SAM protein with 4Fe4S-binding SPASM domain